MVFLLVIEIFGNVVFELFVCGIFVIGVNSGGVKNIIIDGKMGVFCLFKNEDVFLLFIYFLL